jgi:hypothetical protein
LTRGDPRYLHASHAQNGNESELLVATHVESLDKEDRKQRKAKVAHCENSRHHICKGYDDVHADACTFCSKCSGPEEFDWAALEHCEEAVDHTHHDAGVDDDMGDTTEELLSDGRIAKQREADGYFGPDHTQAVGEVANPPKLEAGVSIEMSRNRVVRTLNAIIMLPGVRSLVSLPVPVRAPPIAQALFSVCIS